MQYKFVQADNRLVERSDSAQIPWDAENNRPLDVHGRVTEQWKDDGSPAPTAYVAPAATVDEVRGAQFVGDVDRQDIVTAIKNATPQQIKNYVNNNVTDLATAKVMLIKIALLVAKTIRD